MQDTVREAGLPKIPPVNPAASPEKEPDTSEHPPTAAPACKTVLLPTLEEAEDACTLGVNGEPPLSCLPICPPAFRQDLDHLSR